MPTGKPITDGWQASSYASQCLSSIVDEVLKVFHIISDYLIAESANTVAGHGDLWNINVFSSSKH